MEKTAVILAAGLGKRMKSRVPKAAHLIARRPMLRHLIAAAETVFDRIVVVVGPEMPALEALAAPHEVVVQTERRGTGHAAAQAAARFGAGVVAVFYADNPLLTPGTMAALLERLGAGAGLVLLANTPPDPLKYGRVILEHGQVSRIVEFADATAAEREVRLCNAGAFAAPAEDLRRWLAALDTGQRRRRILFDRHRRRGPARRCAGGGAGSAPTRSASGSTPGANWRRPKRWRRPGCARRRWRPESRCKPRKPCSLPPIPNLPRM